MSRTLPALFLLATACADDPAAGADAAACTCAPAEPPLAGRLTRIEGRMTRASAFIDAWAICPDGALLLGGGCYLDDANLRAADLTAAGWPSAVPNEYHCVWNNPAMTELTAVAWAMCLVPAP